MGGRRWCIAGRGRLVGHDQTGHGQGTCLVTRRRRRAIYLSRPNREQIDRALCAVSSWMSLYIETDGFNFGKPET
jgi:hypothetical protein